MADITPPIIYLVDNIRTILVQLGYDEIKSWPLIKESEQRENGTTNRSRIN